MHIHVYISYLPCPVYQVESKIVQLSDSIESSRAVLADLASRGADRDDAEEEERAENELRILTQISESQRAMRMYQVCSHIYIHVYFLPLIDVM